MMELHRRMEEVLTQVLRPLDRVESEGAEGHPELILDCFECSGERKLYVNGWSGRWLCYRCSAAGRSPVRLLVAYGRLSESEARRTLRRIGWFAEEQLAEFGGPIVKPPPTVPEPLPPEFEFCVHPKTQALCIPAYLTRRGVGIKTMVRFGLGWCSSGRYGQRVILPFMRVGGAHAGFTARAVNDWTQPKYLTSSPLDKDTFLFGLNRWKLRTKELVLVEGPFDVLALDKIHIPAAAVLGKTLSLAQAQILHRAGITSLTVMLDGDDPMAPLAAIEIADLLKRPLAGGYRAKVADLPIGRDPGSATELQIRRALDEAVVPGLIARSRAERLKERALEDRRVARYHKEHGRHPSEAERERWKNGGRRPRPANGDPWTAEDRRYYEGFSGGRGR